MGEYIKYNGEECKIGTLESLYYTTFQKFTDALAKGKLSQEPGSDQPENYVKADSGFKFRFPFPDEDHLPFGGIKEPYNRGVPILVDAGEDNGIILPQEIHHMEITQQKLIHRESDGALCLAMVYRDPVRQQSFRVEDEQSIRAIVGQILKNHVLNEVDKDKKNFYRQMAIRILKGYRMKKQVTEVKEKNKTHLRPMLPIKRKPTKRRGNSL